MNWFDYDPLKYFPDKSDTANPFYQNIFELDKKLTAANIPHELIRLFDGWQVVYPSIEKPEGDFISHFGSYGHELDLLEGYGFTIQDVIPNATVDEAFEVIERYHKTYHKQETE